ncbi:hypothetical protein Tco_1472205, partial [Tanacetum coccineum]
KPACPRKLLLPLILVGGGSLEITLIFALSTLRPTDKMCVFATLKHFIEIVQEVIKRASKD